MSNRTSKRKVGGPPPSRAIRNLIRNFDARNIAESRGPSDEYLEKQVRAQIQRDYPLISNSEVERRVANRLAMGMKPCKPKAPSNENGEKLVSALEVNRAERKAIRRRKRRHKR